MQSIEERLAVIEAIALRIEQRQMDQDKRITVLEKACALYAGGIAVVGVALKWVWPK